MEGFFAGIGIAVIAVIITIAIVGSNVSGAINDRWRVDAVAHGYAHYNIDSSWHWNNEGAR